MIRNVTRTSCKKEEEHLRKNKELKQREASYRGGTMYLLEQLKGQARRPMTAGPGSTYRPIRSAYLPKFFPRTARKKRRVTIADPHVIQDKGTGTGIKDSDRRQPSNHPLQQGPRTPSPTYRLRKSSAPPRTRTPREAKTTSPDETSDTMTAVIAPLSNTTLSGHGSLPRKGSYASNSSDNNNVLDLPPIGNGVRVRSRPSSGSNSQKRNSLPENGYVGHLTVNQQTYSSFPRTTQQRPPKISVNTNPNDGRSKRSPLSPASTGSTTSSPMSGNNMGPVKVRGPLKSWSSTEQTLPAANQKLETLFERQNTNNNTKGNNESNKNNKGLQQETSTRARHESTGNSSSGVYSRLDSKAAKRGSLYHSSQSNNTNKGNGVYKPGLQRYKSEQNISQQQKSRTTRPLRQVKSQGQLSHFNLHNSRSIPNLLSAEHSDHWQYENGDAFDSESDNEKDSRIMEWIIGVEQLAEPPPEPPAVIDEDPPQTDTAIHIVYEES